MSSSHSASWSCHPPPFLVESWVFTYSLIPLPVAALPSIEPDRCSWVNHNYSAKPCVRAASSSEKLRGPPWRFPHGLTPYRDRVQTWRTGSPPWRSNLKAWGRRGSQAQASSILSPPVLGTVCGCLPVSISSPISPGSHWWCREQDPGEQRGTHAIRLLLSSPGPALTSARMS